MPIFQIAKYFFRSHFVDTFDHINFSSLVVENSDVHEPVRFVEGWARGVRARVAGSSLGSSFIIKKIIKIFINDTKYLIFA
jgi:hypothetical protein